jgi:hypothetical protein
MADLKNGTTSYPTSIDTGTLIADGVDQMAAANANGLLSAMVAVETELGTGLKGTLANLSTRLAITLATDGGLLRGSAFPVSPPAVTHFFWRTDLEKLYVYDITAANYVEIAIAASLTDYMSKTTGVTVTAVHQFNPAAPGAPFTLGANAQNQRITGLAADKVWDGVALRSASPTPTANTIPVSNATKDLLDRNSNAIFACGQGATGTTFTGVTVAVGGTGTVLATLGLGSCVAGDLFILTGGITGGTNGTALQYVDVLQAATATTVGTISTLDGGTGARGQRFAGIASGATVGNLQTNRVWVVTAPGAVYVQISAIAQSQTVTSALGEFGVVFLKKQ